jgi:hypothetical protein
LAAHDNNCVSTKHEVLGTLTKDIQSLFPGEAFGTGLRRFSFPRYLGNFAGLNDEWNAGILKKFPTARRCRGKYEGHESLILSETGCSFPAC